MRPSDEPPDEATQVTEALLICMIAAVVGCAVYRLVLYIWSSSASAWWDWLVGHVVGR